MSLREAGQQTRRLMEQETRRAPHYGGRRTRLETDEQRAELAATERRLLELARRAIQRAAPDGRGGRIPDHRPRHGNRPRHRHRMVLGAGKTQLELGVGRFALCRLVIQFTIFLSCFELEENGHAREIHEPNLLAASVDLGGCASHVLWGILWKR